MTSDTPKDKRGQPLAIGDVVTVAGKGSNTSWHRTICVIVQIQCVSSRIELLNKELSINYNGLDVNHRGYATNNILLKIPKEIDTLAARKLFVAMLPNSEFTD